MNILIASAGRTSSQLAKVLLKQNHNVSVIESRPEVLQYVHKELPTDVIFEGEILDPDTLSLEERNQLIKENPAYGNIICRCEMITEGEILDAIHRPLGARSLDGVKRRTRAGMGRCQSGFCSPKVMEILEREVPMPVDQIGKNGVGSEFIVGENKELGDE